MTFFDSHAHYNDARFGEEYPGGAEAAISASREAGCIGIFNAGTNAQTSRESLALCDKYDFFAAAVGIHPYDCELLDICLDLAVAEIEELCRSPKAYAIGEIGLDYHYEGIDRAVQKNYFTAQLELARSLSMPVVIHDRDAHGDMYEILRDFRDVKVLLHSYSGSPEAARQLISDGRYISFSGTVTYKNAHNIHESCAIVPSDRILCETDCPYLPPVPHRGKINLSAYIPHTISAIAEIRSQTSDEVAEMTVQNTKEFFGISKEGK